MDYTITGHLVGVTDPQTFANLLVVVSYRHQGQILCFQSQWGQNRLIAMANGDRHD